MISSAWAICREIRRRAGWTQRRLAEAAGTTPATIARIEKARMEPTLLMLTRLAAAADLDLAVQVRDRDPDEAKARAALRALSPEERLRQNQRMTAMRVQ